MKARERGGVEPTEPEPTGPEEAREEDNREGENKDPGAQVEEEDKEGEDRIHVDTHVDMKVPSDTESDGELMRKSVKQKIDRYEAKVDRETKRVTTDMSRAKAAGLGQELSPGKRGTLEEAARDAAEMIKKPRTDEDRDLLRLADESRVDVAEIFSRPRVTTEAKKFGLAAGEAIDLATGWDLMKTRDRKRCMQWLRQNRPQVVILSPPCTAFSGLQSLNKWSAKREREF